MDVEKTMEFILQQQAKAEGQMAAIRQQQSKAEGQMAAIRKLIQTGMRMIVKQGEHIDRLATTQEEMGTALREMATAQKELAAAQKDLAKSQKVTEVKLQGLIDALRRGRNGSHSKN
jgi:chromosome segregation ATPase